MLGSLRRRNKETRGGLFPTGAEIQTFLERLWHHRNTYPTGREDMCQAPAGAGVWEWFWGGWENSWEEAGGLKLAPGSGLLME